MATSAFPSTSTTSAADILSGLLDDRWSCRAFHADPVPRPVIERVLSMAQRSPSWCNTQPWQVIITSGGATDAFRDALTAHVRAGGESGYEFAAPDHYRGVYRDRRREAGWQLYEAVGIARGDREGSARQAMENFRFFGAPHVAIVTTDAEQETYGAVDAGLYIGTFLLAAQSMGLGAIPQAALAGYSPFIRDYLSIADDRKILAGISFGYADIGHPVNSYRTGRADLTDVVTFIGE